MKTKKKISVITRGSEDDFHLIFITGHGSFGSEEILDEYTIPAEKLLNILQKEDELNDAESKHETAQQYLKRWSLSDETCFSDNGESFCTSELMEIYAQQEIERAVSEFKERLINHINSFNIVKEMGAYQYKEGLLFTSGSANLSGKVFDDAIKMFKIYLIEKLK